MRLWRRFWRAVYLCAALAAASGVFAAPSVAPGGSVTQNVTFTTVATSTSFNVTVPAVGGRVLVVAVHLNTRNSTATTVQSVTFGTTQLAVGQTISSGGAPDVRTEAWYVAAPPAGTASLQVQLANVSANVSAIISATTFQDTDPAGVGGSPTTAAGNNNAPTSAIASAAGQLVIDFVTARENNPVTTATIGAGQTALYNTNNGATNNNVLAVASREPGAASVTMSYTLSASTRWAKAGGTLFGATTDISVSGYADPDLVDGSPTNVTFRYFVKASSIGANGVNFSATLPAGLSIVSATTTQGTCTPGATTNCSIGSLADDGSTATIDIVATTSGGALATTYVLTGTATTTTPQTNTANDAATLTVRTQNHLCATPGKDGAAGTITGSVNTYYPGTANAAAGATTITLGAVPAGYGASNIAIGDLLLVIQMQDSAIATNNDDRYGDGAGTGGNGTPGSGVTSLNNGGRYEYVVATNAVTAAAGGAVNFTGAGVGGGLIYSYVNGALTATTGQRRFQVIRVPQYTTATLAAGTTAPAWNGAVGGVLAMDVQGTVTMGSSAAAGTVATTNGSPTVTGTGTTFTTRLHPGDPITISGQGTYTVLHIASNTSLTLASNATATNATATFTVPQVSVSGIGFRGGAGRQLAGAAGANTDYLTTAATATNGMKGEGVVGTPRYLFQGTGTALDTAVDGYPNGSGGRGAPGNAGGGGTDGNPAANDQNTGGGGGANAGAGGDGGNAWSTATASGGYGGTFDSPSTTRLLMGGGGGAGSTNNGTQGGAPNLGANGIQSSGAAGGGIVLIRANQINGTGTITANGASALDVLNDAGGGGGAGGTVVIQTQYGTLTSLTISARGGAGGDAWRAQANPAPPNDFPGERHGPGGGGGGGAIYLSSAAGTTDVSGGANGLTTVALDNFGASPGQPGIVSTPLGAVAGADSSYSCAIADLAVTNTDAPDPVTPGSNITYTQTLTNNGPNFADQVAFSTAIPASANYQSMTVPPGWTCITPAVGGTGSINCTASGLASGATANFTVTVQANIGTPVGFVISDTANATSLTPDSNYTNNTATTTTNVTDATHADLRLTITAPATVAQNTNIAYTQTLTNLGGGSAANPSFTETTPPGTTFQSLTPPAGWTCITPAVNGTGTITCSAVSAMASGASVSFPLQLRATGAIGTSVTLTGSTATTSNDPYLPNNTASATTTIVAANSADLAVTVTALQDDVGPADFIQFVDVVTNNGIVATNATIAGATHTVPANTTFVSMTVPAGWTCTLPAVGSPAGTQIPCSTTGTMAVGASASFVEKYQVVAGTPTSTVITRSTTVAVAAPPAGVTDSVAANNTASDTTTVRAHDTADLAITKTDSPDPIGAGQHLTYLLKVVNNGPEVATGIIVSDTLPAGEHFLRVAPSQGSCSGTSTITCSIGSLAVNATATVSLVVQVDPSLAGGTVNNTATVTGTLTDPVAGNNSATSTTTVLAVTLVRLRDFNATQEKNKVSLTWQTDFEADNLGFNLYREFGGQRVRINKNLIAGTALLSKKHDARSGFNYSFRDKLADGQFAQYWLEDVDLFGVTTLHGPVSPVAGIASNDPDSPPLPGRGEDGNVIASQDGFGVVRPLSIGTPTSQQFKQQFDLAGDAGLKIYVTREGWYRVTRAAMIAAGYDPGSDGKKISVYVAGIEQQVNVDDGGDGSFDASDAVEFYGVGLDTVSTGARTYWLRAGKGTGDRIKLSKDKGGDPVSGSVPFTYRRDERSFFVAAIADTPDESSNFFGPIITGEPVTQPLTVGNLDAAFGGVATVEVDVQGATENLHIIAFSINGHSIGTATLDRQAHQTFTFTFPHSFLTSGTNGLTMQSLSPGFDASVLSSTRLTYQHLLRADNGALEVTLAGGRAATVGGFTSARIRAIDVTDAQRPIDLETSVVASGAEFSATFTPSGSGARVVLVTQDTRSASPTEMSANKPSSINTTKGADLVIVSHNRFLAAASTLKPVREAEGISTLIADIDDVYDEFNFGIRDPQAVRTMLQTSRQWKTPPRFVLLVGDASYDPRNYFGIDTPIDFVPTKLIATDLMKTASDDWMADLTGDGVADVAIGRIPVRTPEDATLVFNKLTSRATPSGSWSATTTLITDVSTDFDFAAAAQSCASLLPQTWSKNFIDLTNAGTSDITSAMNNGALIVDYIGHGSTALWGTNNVFHTSNASALTNGSRLPFVVTMTCLSGYFHDLFTLSMAEALLQAPNGGAIAVWASSTLTEPDQQALMNAELFRILTASPQITIGEACLKAKLVVSEPDVKRSWMLFGDPSMRLR